MTYLITTPASVARFSGEVIIVSASYDIVLSGQPVVYTLKYFHYIFTGVIIITSCAVSMEPARYYHPRLAVAFWFIAVWGSCRRLVGYLTSCQDCLGDMMRLTDKGAGAAVEYLKWGGGVVISGMCGLWCILLVVCDY